MSRSSVTIDSPEDDKLGKLCGILRDLSPELTASGWPMEQLAACARHGVFEWFISPDWNGQGWADLDIVRGYLALSKACLTTTFVITQRTGACQRIEMSDNQALKERLLPDLAAGRCFATVGISHLTTSGRHLAQPVLRAEETPRGFVLDGFCPWVTGSTRAELIVVGATLADDRELLVAMPTDVTGVSTPPATELVGLTESQTGRVCFERAEVERSWLLAGPVEQVMKQGVGARTGGLQTSTLALGLAAAAIEYLANEALNRPDLRTPSESLRAEWQHLKSKLLSAAEGVPVCSNEELRTRANSLVLRATQAALAAAKGTGYAKGHAAGRWCTEALFFLVWSCPQPVMAANLCELAGIT